MSPASNVLTAEGMNMVVDKDNIATIYLNNGENRVRLSYVKAFNKILDEVERNTSIRGLIITGTDKYFSLGLDLEHFKTQTPEHVLQIREGISNLHMRIMLFPIPTVAAINGHAYGAGAFLTLACDYRVMRSDRGWLCWPEVALGMQIKMNNYVIMRAKIPLGRAFREAIVFGKPMSGRAARGLQIVDVVCDQDKLETEAKRLVQASLGKRGIGRKALANMKKDVYVSVDPLTPVTSKPKL